MAIHFRQLAGYRTVHSGKIRAISCLLVLFSFLQDSHAQSDQNEANHPQTEVALVPVDFQPLAANIKRLGEALKSIGSPFSDQQQRELDRVLAAADSKRLQQWLDSMVSLQLTIDQRSNLSLDQIPKSIKLYQNEHRALLVKVINRTGSKSELKLSSPSAGAVYGGTSLFSLKRQQQTALGQNQTTSNHQERYLDLELYRRSPMTRSLGGLKVEYLIVLLHCNKTGTATPNLHLALVDKLGNQQSKNQKNGQSHNDKPSNDKPEAALDTNSKLGKCSTQLSLNVEPANLVKFDIRDETQQTNHPIARIEIRDHSGRVYPNQPKRLAPDLFFQPQIYRRSGEYIELKPGRYRVRFCRGPEYKLLEKNLIVQPQGTTICTLDLQRWIQPAKLGFYSGDHHIHAAGCSHYTSPTQGITPQSMYRQVTGEGLNVGCVLTWGPCFDFQRNYFSPNASSLGNGESLLKYDIEVSGFGSQALGHVCLLNLTDQTYPNSAGSKTRGWPTWTTPVMKWAKEQGGYTGYAHSASGLSIDSRNASLRLLRAGDQNQDKMLSHKESEGLLLPFEFPKMDRNQDQQLSLSELIRAHDTAANQLPNFAIPEMNGVGAMEICVAAVAGVCDFISAMDTARIQEWNTWYHLLNCGFPIKVSGETDFPCMSSRRVGKGRVYVDMGRTIPPDQTLDFAEWCQNLALGRSYVSDGFAHAPSFTVNGIRPGFGDVKLKQSAEVNVEFQVAFAAQTPAAVAHGTHQSPIEPSKIGDTVELHHPREHQWITGGTRKLELIVNGQPVAVRTVKADGKIHSFQIPVKITQSSWIAVRQFPQLHTNPVNVRVGDKPIRASRRSALWCKAMTELVWVNRQRTISPKERPAAAEMFAKTIKRLAEIADESDRQ